MENLLLENDNMDSPKFITVCSFSHFFWGFIFLIVMKHLYSKMSFIFIFFLYLVIHTIYEIKDTLCYFGINIISNKESNNYFMNNSYLNSIGDTIFALLGVYTGSLYLKNKNNIYLQIFIFIPFLLSCLCALKILKEVNILVKESFVKK